MKEIRKARVGPPLQGTGIQLRTRLCTQAHTLPAGGGAATP